MEVQFYTDVDSFRELCTPFLTEREAENNLIIGILGIISKNLYLYGSEDPILALVTEKETIKLVSIRTPPFNLLLSYTDDISAITLLVEKFKEKKLEFPGVAGFKEGAIHFAQLWTEKSHKELKHVLEVQTRIYRLDKVNPKTIGNNLFRTASISDLEVVSDWVGDFLREAVPNTTENEIQRNKERVIDAIKEQSVYLLEVENKIVSLARRTGPTPNGERIGLVYTPPNERRKGYATEIVAKLSQLLLDEGKTFCFLYTDLANPTSNKIYQDIGYKPIMDSDTYRFNSLENQEE